MVGKALENGKFSNAKFSLLFAEVVLFRFLFRYLVEFVIL